jgi:hypothetical protein
VMVVSDHGLGILAQVTKTCRGNMRAAVTLSDSDVAGC